MMMRIPRTDSTDRNNSLREYGPRRPVRSPEDLAHEGARSLVLRMLENVERPAFLEDDPAIHENDPGRYAAREAHFVRDDDHGHAFVGEVRHHVEHFPNVLRIQGRRGLVEQHGLRIHREGTCDRDSLLLAAAELRRVWLLLRGEAHTGE